jgi:hypothetical protein
MSRGFDGDFTKALNIEMKKGAGGSHAIAARLDEIHGEKTEEQHKANLLNAEVASVAAWGNLHDVMDAEAVQDRDTLAA